MNQGDGRVNEQANEKTIDLNLDAGEAAESYGIMRERELFALVSSVNIACGFHAGDPATMKRSVELAAKHSLHIGAHVGFPDRVGFGRRLMQLSFDELYSDTLYQIGALNAFVNALGLPLDHVKPHGALYNHLAYDEQSARAVAYAVRDIDPELPIMVLAGAPAVFWLRREGLSVIEEGFCDRGYASNGQLLPRSHRYGIIHEGKMAAEQAFNLANNQRAYTENGFIPIIAQTLCIHGDQPNALSVAKAVRETLEAAGFTLRGP
jgi:5-oxoprolinase (ATP-hydrolysing) subunit A